MLAIERPEKEPPPRTIRASGRNVRIYEPAGLSLYPSSDPFATVDMATTRIGVMKRATVHSDRLFAAVDLALELGIADDTVRLYSRRGARAEGHGPQLNAAH